MQISGSGIKTGTEVSYRIADRKTQYRYTTYGAAVCKSTVYRYRHLEKSVAFHRMDACDELVDVDVVLLLALNQAHAHMEMLSRIILMCQDEAFIEELMRAEQETDIEQIVRERLEGGKQHES